MPEKSFAIDYFRLNFKGSDTAERMVTALRDSARLVDPSLAVRTVDKWIRFARIDQPISDNGVWTGDIEALDMFLTRHKANLDRGGTEAIPLEEREKISELSAFLYYAPLRVIVMQHSREGATIKRFCELIGAILERPVAYQPIIRPEAIERVLRLDRPTKVKIAYAGSKPPKDYQKGEPSGLFSVGYDFDARTTEVILGLGRYARYGSLNWTPLQNVMNMLFGEQKEEGIELLKFVVEGAHDGPEEDEGTYREVIDLLKDRLRDRAFVMVSDVGTLPFALRVGELKRSFETYQEGLHNILDQL